MNDNYSNYSTLQKIYVSFQRLILVIIIVMAISCLTSDFDEYYVLLDASTESVNNYTNAYVIHSRYWGWTKCAYSLRYSGNKWHVRINGKWEEITFGVSSARDPVFWDDIFIQSDRGGLWDGHIKHMK